MTVDTIFECEYRDSQSLHNALSLAVGPNFIGISTNAELTEIRVHSEQALSQQEESDAQATIDNHDPVYLFVDTTQIDADGIDIATVTVQSPKPGAAGVTLDINGQSEVVTMIDGVGTVEITAIDPVTIEVTIINAENRTTDSLTIEAV
jgi:hypothetical protein